MNQCTNSDFTPQDQKKEYRILEQLVFEQARGAVVAEARRRGSISDDLIRWAVHHVERIADEIATAHMLPHMPVRWLPSKVKRWIEWALNHRASPYTPEQARRGTLRSALVRADTRWARYRRIVQLSASLSIEQVAAREGCSRRTVFRALAADRLERGKRFASDVIARVNDRTQVTRAIRNSRKQTTVVQSEARGRDCHEPAKSPILQLSSKSHRIGHRLLLDLPDLSKTERATKINWLRSASLEEAACLVRRLLANMER